MTRRIGSLAWLADRPDWQADAACLGQGPDCFRYAMRHNIKHGVWGGTSVTERRNIRRRRLARAA